MERLPHELAGFLTPKPVAQVLRTIQGAGHEGWVVGGAVRDLLLATSPSEFDLATNASPDQIVALFPRVIETGIAHGTVTVVMDGLPLEVTTYRAGRAYAAPTPAFVGTIEEDLAMRDFTVNAMAFDPLEGRFLDPFGGRKDLKCRTIRAVGDARARFLEDPLRPMRACRFASRLGFRIEKETRRVIPDFAEAFRGVAVERVGAEFSKILVAPHPRYGIDLLRKTGLLEVFLPELLEGFGMRQNRWHRWDVYHHVLRALDAAKPDLIVRLAVLLHDIDKPVTMAPSEKRQGESTFYGHEISGAKRAREICRRLRFSQRIGAEVELLVREHQFLYTSAWKDAAVRRMVARVGDSFERLVAVREADIRGHGVEVEAGLALLADLEDRVKGLLERQPALQIVDLALDGEAVMEVLQTGPSPKVGEALRFLLDQVLEDPSRNERETLLRLLGEWLRQEL